MKSAILGVLLHLFVIFVPVHKSIAQDKAGNLFTDAERASIVAFWNETGRCTVESISGATSVGPWEARLTPAASHWFYLYRRALNASSLPPGRTEKPVSGDQALWDEWVSRKLSYDRWKAQVDADGANAAYGIPEAAGLAPPEPGLIPSGLVEAAGNPPIFAAAVARQRYCINFGDNEEYSYTTHVSNRPRFAYFRFSNGVQSIGTMLKYLPQHELDQLFMASGMTPFEQRVSRAVSVLEGGFDSINTYDTGYVSVGFIQFITAEDSQGSLLEVMALEKQQWPSDFENDFRRYGVDISDRRLLTVIDPSTGAELSGRDAVMKVIDDKRLIAIFQRAGRHSVPFRVAQVRVAKSHYWPGDDTFSVVINGSTVEYKVSDLINSEAGMAVLFDRKVNRGTISPFADVVQNTATKHVISSLDDLKTYEREIIQSLIYRTDFLTHPELSQPK